MAHELDTVFRELGLSQYLDSFVDQGFDTWDTILDIQESDLDALGVKLGHRRKLQRRIANARGIAPSVSLASSAKQAAEDGKQDASRSGQHRGEANHEGSGVVKRKYRRHPKPDENAPERPPSAYVLFSNKMREDLKSHNLTFTEIAKLVGENWQSLPPAEKEAYESQANAAKEKYHRDLVEYKKTPEYRKYAQYLQEFKEKQAKQNQDANKRPKIEPARLRHGSTSSSAATGVSATSSSGSGSLRGSRSSSEKMQGSEPSPAPQDRLASTTLTAEPQSSHLAHRIPTDDSRGVFELNGVRNTQASRDLSSRDGTGARRSDRGAQHLPSLSDVLDDGRSPLSATSSTDSKPYATSGFVAANQRRPAPDAPSAMPPNRVPLLRHEGSSTGSNTSAGSANGFGRPLGDGPLPIHALLSNRPGANPAPPLYEQHSPPTLPAASSPVDPVKSTIPHTQGPRGYGFQSAPSALQHMKIEQSNGGDVVMTAAGSTSGAPPGHGSDGLQALLRAGEIVSSANTATASE